MTEKITKKITAEEFLKEIFECENESFSAAITHINKTFLKQLANK